MCNGAIFWPGSMNIAFLGITARILKVPDGLKCQLKLNLILLCSSQRLLLNALFHTHILLQCLNKASMLSGKGTFVKICG